MPEPRTGEEALSLFSSLKSLDSWTQKGPLVKLMRWFSFFESMAFMEGEFICTKMLYESCLGKAADGSDREVEDKPLQDHASHQKELAELKKRKGTWNLAPELITPKALAVKDCIMSVGKASWQLFAEKAREIVSPNHVLEYNVSCSHNQFWKLELVEMIHTSLFDLRHLYHLQPEFQEHDDVLLWHVDLFTRLLEQRSTSLAVFHGMPPLSYAHILSPLQDVAREAHRMANKHWKILLEAEGASLEGVQIHALKHMHWRLNPLMRVLLMAFEEDEKRHAFFSGDSSARRLMLVIAKNIGDSRIVENIHQHGRDLYRTSKTNSLSNTAVMSNALRSGVLEQRKVDMVSFDAVAKAMGPTWNEKWKGSVASSLRSKGTPMTKQIQRLMLPQSKKMGHSWPTPAPASLFTSVAATTWLFAYWGNPLYRDFGANSSWISVLAKPGLMLAQRSAGLMVLVMASAEFGFLGIDIKVVVQDGKRWMLCRADRDSIRWHHVCSLEDWIQVPIVPGLLHGHRGPVGWTRTGEEPVPLLVGALVSGSFLTHAQACDLIKQLGGKLPKNPSKKVVMTQLIDMVVPDEQKEVAMQHIKEKDTQDDDFDTDFSEIISELGQDDANTSDLKDLKKKQKQHRMKRTVGKDHDEPLQGKPKAKAKGKAKAKAKGKPKAEPSLGSSLLKRAKDLLKHKDQMDVDPDPNAPMPAPSVPAQVAPNSAMPAPSEPAQVVAQDVAMPDPMVPPVAEAEPNAGPPLPPPAGAPRPPRAARRRSPEEIMVLLEPPGCKFGISHQDHRFTSTWKKDHKELGGVLGQKSFTRTFVRDEKEITNKKRMLWPAALKEVHKHNWDKWEIVKSDYPLGDGEDAQVGGQIPDDILEQLKAPLAELTEIVRYR